MTQYSKYNIVYRLQKWIDSVPGQTFLNYAYSWGASIVILGTLFKLTHLPGANIMLYIGMGTEVLVFFISAFDRPFDKTAIGKELPTHYEDEDDGESAEDDSHNHATYAGAPVIIAGGIPAAGNGFTGTADVAPTDENSSLLTPHSSLHTPDAPLPTPDAAELQAATANYVEELKTLTETLQKVSEQSQRLTRDSEEMENLNRTLTGISKVYEMQLKSASSQIGTIDEINGQTRKLAEQITELNKIYTRMIEAMTVNMRAAGNTMG